MSGRGSRVVSVMGWVLLAGLWAAEAAVASGPAAEDPAVQQAKRCEEHMKSLYGATLDAEQRACVEGRIRSTSGFDPAKTSDCEEPLHACAGFGALNCLAQVDRKYRVGTVAASLALDLASDYEEVRTCIGDNARRMSLTNAVTRCENVLKIHCPGLDLLEQIGDEMLRQCKSTLAASMGIDPDANADRMRCLDQRIHDRYGVNGETTDAAACKTIFLEECAPAKALPPAPGTPQGQAPPPTAP